MGLLGSLLGQTALQTPYDFALWGGALCLTFIVLWFIIWLLIAIWVYKDAEARGMGGALWLIIVILIGLIGLIIYLVVRKDKPVAGQQPGYAPYQQQQYQPPPAQQYQAPSAARFCPKCGASNTGTAGFCQSCGGRL